MLKCMKTEEWESSLGFVGSLEKCWKQVVNGMDE